MQKRFQSKQKVYGSPLISNKFNLVTIKHFRENKYIDKKTVVNRMKELLSNNGGLMMDVKLNAQGDLLCYVVLSQHEKLDLLEAFDQEIVPELSQEGKNLSLICLGPKPLGGTK